jgi:hypothetical protein
MMCTLPRPRPEAGSVAARSAVAFAGERLRRLAAGVVTLWLIAAAAGPVSPAASAEPEDAIGHVVRQQGAVTAVRDAVARPLHLGAAVYRGDRIVTATAAKAEIEFRDGSTLAVGAESDVEIVAFAPEDGMRGRLTLLIGIVRTSLSDLWRGGFEVWTQAAIASVRSTEWVTEAQAERSSVFVVAGVVEVTGTADGTRVTLREAEGTDVELSGAPSPPKRWGSPRVEDVLARTRLP